MPFEKMPIQQAFQKEHPNSSNTAPLNQLILFEIQPDSSDHNSLLSGESLRYPRETIITAGSHPYFLPNCHPGPEPGSHKCSPDNSVSQFIHSHFRGTVSSSCHFERSREARSEKRERDQGACSPHGG